MQNKGAVSEEELKAFFDAGYDEQQAYIKFYIDFVWLPCRFSFLILAQPVVVLLKSNYLIEIIDRYKLFFI